MAGIAGGLYKQVFSVASTMESLADIPRSTIFRRNAVFLSAVFGGAFAFEIGFDQALTKFWDWNNKGRQWKDIRYKYVENED